MVGIPSKLKSKLKKREEENSLRELPSSAVWIDFFSNDYLGLAQEPAIEREAEIMLKTYPKVISGATGSRLLSGNHVLYFDLENFICQHHNSEAALVFNSGYDANVGLFSSVPQRGDVVLYDELAHASIRDGIKMGNAQSYKFQHNDLEDLENRIKKIKSKSADLDIYVVTESVFSMDGDSPDLISLSALCVAHDCYLIVDEAHAAGIFGQGRDLISDLGLSELVFARIITFGKAIGHHGAAVLGSRALKNYLVNFARSLIYTTALPPHSLAMVLSAYVHMNSNGHEAIRILQENIAHFKVEKKRLGLEDRFISSDSAIHCLILPGNEKVKQLALHLQSSGYGVKPILSPTVKAGSERLRICLHSYNTKEEISRVLQEIKSYLGQ